MEENALKFCSLASGSNGNCIYIGTENTHILVDAGISNKRMEEGLRQVGIEPDQLAGIFITHEHSDHVQGLPIFTKKHPKVPVYATEHTLDALIAEKMPHFAPENGWRPVEYGRPWKVGSITATPFPISHDAKKPVSYAFCDGRHKIGMVTDLGCYDSAILDALKNCDILYLEANHDVNMLMVGRYSYALKLRIRGNKGHLSNDDAAELAASLLHPNLKHIVLGHLSKDNNYPELAYETVRQEIMKKWSFPAAPPDVLVASRGKPSKILTIPGEKEIGQRKGA